MLIVNEYGLIEDGLTGRPVGRIDEFNLVKDPFVDYTIGRIEQPGDRLVIDPIGPGFSLLEPPLGTRCIDCGKTYTGFHFCLNRRW